MLVNALHDASSTHNVHFSLLLRITMVSVQDGRSYCTFSSLHTLERDTIRFGDIPFTVLSLSFSNERFCYNSKAIIRHEGTAMHT